MMKKLKNEKQYDKALKRIENAIDSKIKTPAYYKKKFKEAKRYNKDLDMVEAYDAIHYPMWNSENLLDIKLKSVKINPGTTNPKSTLTSGMVNHPKHYCKNADDDFETIKVIYDWGYGHDFCIGNAIKYISRSNKKALPIQDLQKAIWYLKYADLHMGDKHKTYDKSLVELFHSWELSLLLAEAVGFINLGKYEEAYGKILDEIHRQQNIKN